MSHYDLARMGWQQFEQLVQSLAIRELGNGVRVFGSGSDGRREATFRGPVSFPRGGAEAPWSGYGVIQAKYQERPKNTTSDWKWFISEVKTELDRWVSKLPPEGPTSPRKWPKYFIFATNVTLSGTEDSGGIDQFDELLRRYQSRLGLDGWFAWDYNQIRALLDGHPSVRQTYLEQICTGDFLSRLEELLPSKMAVTGKQLAVHAASELAARQWVRIGDSGYRDSSKLRLSDIGIDLPCEYEPRSRSDSPTKTYVGNLIVNEADAVHRPSAGDGARGIIVIGGPGQGKSTVAQLIAHNYRVAFIRDADTGALGPKASESIEQMNDRLRSENFPEPQRRRFPIFIDLAQYASQIASQDSPASLLRFAAQSILVAGHPLDPSALLEWVAVWPVCLILDGLDEVPNVRLRTKLIDSISAFITEASSRDVDLFVVATTRPQGYSNEFSEALTATRATLIEFTETEALAYADSIIATRSQEDPAQAAQVTMRLFDAVHQRLTQRLMTTPLQVTIMTALAERSVDLPTTRYELFDAYYSTIYDREVGKSPSFKKLGKLRSHIDYLHEQAGYRLQTRNERVDRSSALLPRKDMSRFLYRRLASAGFDEEDAKNATQELLTLASDRLVLLVSPRGQEYGFEVRSIQEYMAARALTEGTDEDILTRLKVLVPSAHWRNTWLLAAGRLLEMREHLAEKLVALVTGYDQRDAETAIVRSGASLAADLYLDEVASDFPALRRAILDSALTLLRDTSARADSPTLSAVVASVGRGSSYEQRVVESLDKLSSESNSNLATKILSEYRLSPDPIGVQARKTFSRGFSYTKPETRDIESQAFVLGMYLKTMTGSELTGVANSSIEGFAGFLTARSPRILGDGPAGQSDVRPASAAIFAMLDDENVRSAVVSAIAATRTREPDVAHYGTTLLRFRASRLPRAAALRTSDVRTE